MDDKLAIYRSTSQPKLRHLGPLKGCATFCPRHFLTASLFVKVSNTISKPDSVLSTFFDKVLFKPLISNKFIIILGGVVSKDRERAAVYDMGMGHGRYIKELHSTLTFILLVVSKMTAGSENFVYQPS